jgi:meso-butanediol dehydrogenase/(S,S)-butanediol dehydrogenase/diacetyl reductase
MRLQDKVALVSGAASGIGAAVVARFVEEGATVVPCDITPIDGGIVCDVRDAEACQTTVAEVVAQHGRLHVLANVAGVAAAHRIEAVTTAEWRRIIDVNLTGTFLLSQAALPALLETKGTIVNMASLAGVHAAPYNAAYCASKGGVVMLTKSMAMELAKTGVRVNAVCPGAVDTPLLGNFQLPDDADFELIMRTMSPTGALIDPAEVAAAVAYLASSEAASVNGAALVIDGGASA